MHILRNTYGIETSLLKSAKLRTHVRFSFYTLRPISSNGTVPTTGLVISSQQEFPAPPPLCTLYTAHAGSLHIKHIVGD